MGKDKYVRFDWAAKRMLRDKANFCILEGLITVLIGEDVRITEILESEGNQEAPNDKFNRVDVKAKNSKGEIIIVEVQMTRELYFLERILYGVAKSITEHISLGDKYDKVKKVYSISILYFDLGKGSDYLYHGQTVFRGVNTGDTLQISTKEKNVIEMKTPDAIFPEYYIIRVNEFNRAAVTPMEEWMQYLRTGNISENTQAPGLQQAKERLQYLQMTPQEQKMYDRHIDAIMVQNDVLSTAQKEGFAEGHYAGMKKGLADGHAKGLAKGLAEGRAEGRAEGLAEGLEEGFAKGEAVGASNEKLAIAKKMKSMGIAKEQISLATGLTENQIDNI